MEQPHQTGSVKHTTHELLHVLQRRGYAGVGSHELSEDAKHVARQRQEVLCVRNRFYISVGSKASAEVRDLWYATR